MLALLSLPFLCILIVLAIIPSIILGWWVYHNDKIEKEPAGLLAIMISGGVLSVIVTLILTLIIKVIFPNVDNLETYNLFTLYIYVFFVIACIEEGTKWFFLNVFSWNSKNFKHPYDGIVYACYVSIGFATIENIIYVLGTFSLTTALLRAILSVPGHVLFFALTMGHFYGKAKKAQIDGNNALFALYMILSYLCPVLIHTFFDYFIFGMSVVETEGEQLIFLGCYILYIICLYVYSFIMIIRDSKIKYNFIEGTEYIDNKHPGTKEGEIIVKNQNQPKTIFCPNCGKPNNKNYCSNCGTKLR